MFFLTLSSSVEKEKSGLSGTGQCVLPTRATRFVHSADGFELSSGPANPNGKILRMSDGKYLLNSSPSFSFASLSRVTFLILALFSASSFPDRLAIRSTQSKRLAGDARGSVSLFLRLGDPLFWIVEAKLVDPSICSVLMESSRSVGDFVVVIVRVCPLGDGGLFVLSNSAGCLPRGQGATNLGTCGFFVVAVKRDVTRRSLFFVGLPL